MTGILQAILSFFGVAPAAAANYIEDVFSTYLYTGNGSTQTITNNIDLSTKGGLVWGKSRSNAYDNFLADSVRGSSKLLYSNNTLAQQTDANVFSSFNSNGFSLGIGGAVSSNTNGATYVSWTFREQAKFFDVVTYTGNGSNRTIAHSLGSVPGCIIIKRTDTAADWQVYHRSLANTEYVVLNSSAAKATGTTRWNSTTPTSTEFSLGTDSTVNANSGTYVAYLFAHDAGGFGATGSDNVISCGSFTTDGSGNATVSLGYEPQWVMTKRTDAAGNWTIVDVMRGMTVNAGSTGNAGLYADSSGAEIAGITLSPLPNATGMTYSNVGPSRTNIYIAIRRGPMKTPTSGTSVFAPVAVSSATSTGTQISNSFVVDAAIAAWRDGTAERGVNDRLRGISTTNPTGSGNPFLRTNTTGAETTPSNVIYQGDGKAAMLGRYFAGQGYNQIYWLWGRAPGFFDVVCYTGDGTNMTINHNLGVVPELMIVKRRSITGSWFVYSAGTTTPNNYYLSLEATTAQINAGAQVWNNTSTTFLAGTGLGISASGQTYVAYLFATVAGVSKVGSYTGTGTTKQIDCGFTAGARFVMIKRTDSTGDWYVWDSARGIVAGNDPYLLMNSTAAEVTNTDYVDTYNAGFEISSTAPAAINANGGTFIFLAIA